MSAWTSVVSATARTWPAVTVSPSVTSTDVTVQSRVLAAGVAPVLTTAGADPNAREYWAAGAIDPVAATDSDTVVSRAVEVRDVVGAAAMPVASLVLYQTAPPPMSEHGWDRQPADDAHAMTSAARSGRC